MYWGLTHNKQPIKTITYQEVYGLKDTLERLQSWIDVLKIINQFFSASSNQLNKKKVIREYHANSQVFHIFYNTFISNVDLLEMQIDKLGKKEKVKI